MTCDGLSDMTNYSYAHIHMKKFLYKYIQPLSLFHSLSVFFLQCISFFSFSICSFFRLGLEKPFFCLSLPLNSFSFIFCFRNFLLYFLTFELSLFHFIAFSLFLYQLLLSFTLFAFFSFFFILPPPSSFAYIHKHTRLLEDILPLPLCSSLYLTERGKEGGGKVWTEQHRNKERIAF